MMTQKQGVEMLRLGKKEKQMGEERRKKQKIIDQFQDTKEKILEGWNTVFNAYTKMLETNPSVFSDPRKVADVLNDVLPKATELIDELMGYNKDWDEYNISVTAYMKDQNDIISEISQDINVDKNLFTLNANQVMRLPDLNKELNELLEDSRFLRQDMEAIEKVVASIRINPN